MQAIRVARSRRRGHLLLLFICLQREYRHEFELKYGANPHEKPSGIYSLKGTRCAESRQWHAGYINLLDACNAYLCPPLPLARARTLWF